MPHPVHVEGLVNISLHFTCLHAHLAFMLGVYLFIKHNLWGPSLEDLPTWQIWVKCLVPKVAPKRNANETQDFGGLAAHVLICAWLPTIKWSWATFWLGGNQLNANNSFVQSILHGIMVCKIDSQIINCDFSSHWMPQTFGLVPQLSKAQ